MSKRQKKFDANIIVIGAGSGGLVASYIAAALKARVILIEKQKMGGDCLNTGCVPSKTLIKTAKLAYQMHNAARWGLPAQDPDIHFADVMARVREAIRTVEPHDSIERYTSLGVKVIEGKAALIDPHTVEVNGQSLRARHIIIATGAEPNVPFIEGIEHSNFWTSDTIWQMQELPKKLAVLGGGAIGCELAQAFSRLGSEVSIIDRNPRLLAREDVDVSEFVAKRFTHEGITVLTETQVLAFHKNTVGAKSLSLSDSSGEPRELAYDAVLLALGRRANTNGFGLEKLGVEIEHTIKHNEFLQTNIPSIYVCGDVAGPYQFTHVASHQAWYATVNALFSPFKRFKVDYRFIPRATFVDPEVARVGFNEQEAREKCIKYRTHTYPLSELDRAITEGEAYGWVKVLTLGKSDTIIGATIVGAHAGDIISEMVLAMKYKIGLNKLLATPHIYPTWAEANKFVAGRWKQATKPEWALSLLERYWRWRRNA